MASLYEIEKALLDFRFEVDDETGEILNAQELDNLKMEKNQKIENIGLWVKNLNAEAEMVKAEKQNMAEREIRLKKKAESLKGYLAFALQGQKFETPRLAISYRKSTSVEITDDSKLPKEFIKEKIEYAADKTAIKKALQGGTEVAGAKLVEKQNLQLK